MYQQRFDIHSRTIENITDKRLHPRIDDYDDYLVVVLPFPARRDDRERQVAAGVAMLVGHDFFITVHEGDVEPLAHMVDANRGSADVSVETLQKTPADLLYEVIDRLVDDMLPMIPELADITERIEDLIFDDPGSSTVQQISFVRRDLITLRRIVKPQLVIVADLEESRSPVLQAVSADSWSDLRHRLNHLWDALEEYQQILEGLSDTHNTLISSRMNDIIKTLTIVSVAVLPMTLVAAWYGMNVPLPFEDSWWALILAEVVMLGTIGLILFYFRRARWL